MFVHTVFFWLKPGLSKADRTRFEKGLTSLTAIDTLVHCWIGTPAATERPVIDTTYDFALTTVFRDRAGHDHYQDVPVHLKFVADCAQYWRKVVVYDAIENAKDDQPGKVTKAAYKGR